MSQTMSVTEVARNFSEIINRVYYQGQTFLLTRGNAVVAKLSRPEKVVTLEEWKHRWNELPHLDSSDADLWQEELTAARLDRTLPESSWDT